MKVVAAVAVALALPVAPAAAAPSAELMVVGESRVLREAKAVRLAERTVRVAGGRCTVGARTPLGVLAGARLRLRLRDYGSCGRSARNAAGLYVRQIGSERERGRGGWVYEVGRRAGTSPAGDPAGPFGRGGLRRGARLLWFWCELGDAGCQRTLEARPERRRVAAGEPVTVRVVGYDDEGRGVAVPGATVRLGTLEAQTGADGRATLVMPAGARRVRVTAAKPGLVPSFPAEVLTP